jgi:hypothetical protein
MQSLFTLFLLVVALSSLHAKTGTGIEFAALDGHSLKLDVHHPAAEKTTAAR